MAAKTMSAPARNDAELVHESLAGNRDAFGQIVARYQSLICSLAYSATGSLSRSEDLSQDTFVTAWKQLPGLREPAQLRSWLCGIARNLISNAQRHAVHEPVQIAEPLDPTHEAAARELSPSEQAISREEEVILWRSLENIPETYREPLVLFYREHQSVGKVAQALELSEDAVKQRLSRGRVLLQEQVLAFVEGTLERSTPGRAFTLSVLAALPVLRATVEAAAVGTTATKGTAAAKAASSAGGGVALFGAILALLGLVGGYVGYQMSDSRAQSPGERVWVRRFWHLFVGGMAVFILPVLVLTMWSRWHPWLFEALTLWLGLFYFFVAVPLAIWAWRHHRRIRGPSAAVEPAGRKPGKSVVVWVASAMIGMVGVLALSLYDTNWHVRRISSAEAQKIVSAHPKAEFSIHQYQSGLKLLWIVLPEKDGPAKFMARLDESTLSLLHKSDIRYETFVQGRDFEVLGWPGRLLFLLAIFVLAAGAVILVRAARGDSATPSARPSSVTPAMR